jgi:hypothetical protein
MSPLLAESILILVLSFFRFKELNLNSVAIRRPEGHVRLENFFGPLSLGKKKISLIFGKNYFLNSFK